MSTTDLNKVSLRPLVAKDFASSESFLEQFGRAITRKGMFLPLPYPFDVGQELTIRFTLDRRKDILAGAVRVVFKRDGANGETPGCGVAFLELSERSHRNLDMILEWREEQAAAAQG